MNMNKWLSAVVLSMSGLLATSAMAAPQDPHSRHYVHQTQQQGWQNHHSGPVNSTNKKLAPSRDWRIGQVMPRQYQMSRYQVDYRAHKHLIQPKRDQQWYKVNGHYVLVNEHGHKIVKIVG